MVNDDSQNMSLGEAATRFLAKLSPEAREANRQAVNNFVRWYGRERPLASLTAPEVANYAERLSLSDTDYDRKLEMVRGFLVYAKKQGWSKTSLSVHLKAKKSKNALAPSKMGKPETITLTPEGYAELVAELGALKKERLEVTEEMRKAAADKDFRENAPLAAARERKGHVEGRIIELEDTLKRAAVIGEKKEASLKANLGDRVILHNITSAEELCYTIVHPTEVDPTKGKISGASPMGKAVIGRSVGETVEIVVPAGKLRYQIKRIER